MDVHPLVDGRCPRCGTAQRPDRLLCFVCSLRLAPGSEELSASAERDSAEWMLANPERAAAWRGGRIAEPREDRLPGSSQAETALADLTAAAVEARVLAQVASQAMEKLRQAHDRCLTANVPAAVIAKHLKSDDLPGVPPLPVQRTRAGGGFAFFYAEAGLDADGDGDVDGGLIDALTGSDDNGAADDGGFFDGLGDLFS